MSDTQAQPVNNRPPSVPRLEVVPEPPKTSDSGEVSIQVPKGLVKWAKGNLALLVVCGYVGGDTLLKGYINAPSDIQEIKAEIAEIKAEIVQLTKAIEQALQRPASLPKEK